MVFRWMFDENDVVACWYSWMYFTMIRCLCSSGSTGCKHCIERNSLLFVCKCFFLFCFSFCHFVVFRWISIHIGIVWRHFQRYHRRHIATTADEFNSTIFKVNIYRWHKLPMSVDIPFVVQSMPTKMQETDRPKEKERIKHVIDTKRCHANNRNTKIFIELNTMSRSLFSSWILRQNKKCVVQSNAMDFYHSITFSL